MYRRFAVRAGLSDDASLVRVVEAVRAIPYRRPTVRTVQGTIDEWVGTCSTKHLLLAGLIRERWPELTCVVTHRVYRISRADALARYGAAVAELVPKSGLVDVHRYLMVTDADGHAVAIDVTFPGGPPWDGRTSMPVAAADGMDVEAGDDPAVDKAALEARFCDPAIREPFIAALAEFGG
jgi:hypothetical protein